MVDDSPDTANLRGFVKIFVRTQLFELARTTIKCSPFLWRLINDPPNAEDGFYHIDRDPEKFKCLINYLVENSVGRTLPCAISELYKESLFYGIQLPENDCWGTTLSYILGNINTYDIRGQLKSFADRNGILGWAAWRQRISLDIEFRCHRTFNLNVICEYMNDAERKQMFIIKSLNETDHRRPVSASFQCPKTRKQDKSSTSPFNSLTSSPSSSESCSELGKDLIKQLTIEDVKMWLQNTMFKHLAEVWITQRVDGKELLEISKTGCLKNGTLMLSGYELIKFKDILNCLGFELEFE